MIQKYFVHLNLGRFVLYKPSRFWCTGGSLPIALRVYKEYICQQCTITSVVKRPFKSNPRNTPFLFYFTTLEFSCCFFPLFYFTLKTDVFSFWRSLKERLLLKLKSLILNRAVINYQFCVWYQSSVYCTRMHGAILNYVQSKNTRAYFTL